MWLVGVRSLPPSAELDVSIRRTDGRAEKSLSRPTSREAAVAAAVRGLNDRNKVYEKDTQECSFVPSTGCRVDTKVPPEENYGAGFIPCSESNACHPALSIVLEQT